MLRGLLIIAIAILLVGNLLAGEWLNALLVAACVGLVVGAIRLRKGFRA